MAQFKPRDSQLASWIAASGNEYTVNSNGFLTIPEENGADIAEVEAGGLFNRHHEVPLAEPQAQVENPETERLGGSIGTEGGGEIVP